MLYSLHVSEFKFAGKLSQILQNYQCSIVEHSEVKETWDAQGQKVKAILSAAFEQKLGGLKAVVEMVKKRGAKSIVIVEEAAEAFRVERSMNGALLRVSMPVVADDMAQSFIFALVASFITDGDSTIAADPVSVDLLKLGDRVAKAQVNVFVNGPTGSGKTTFLGQLSLDFAEQGVNTLWGSFEIKNTRLVSKLLQQFSREPLPVGQPDKLEDLRALADRFEDLPLHFLRFHGSADIDAVIEAMKYAAYVHDVEHVILDNMQFMISRDQAGGSSYDKFDMQDIAIAKFRKFATENNVHVTLVCHPRKEDEGVRLGISSVFGSAKATQEADTVLILQNDGKRKCIEVKKNRYDGTLGMAPLHFQRGSGRYTEKPEFDFSGVKEQVKAQHQTQMSAPVQQQAKKMVARQITTKAATPIKATAAPKKRNIPTQEPSSPVDDANNAVKPPSSDDRWGEIMSN